MRKLADVAQICKFHLDMEALDAAAATTIFMLFTKIVRDEPQTRALFMHVMFPRWREVLECKRTRIREG